MPLSPQDQAYWKEKLGWKAFVFLLLSTSIMGCIVWPLVLFALDWSGGHADQWTWADALAMAQSHFPLALLVTVIMWFFGQLYYWMGWLPSRR